MFWSLCGDHSDVISPSDGKTYIIVFNCFDTPAVYRVDVSLPQTSGNTAQQKSQNVLLFLTDWNDDGHFSCASRGANGDWCFAAVESGDDAFGMQVRREIERVTERELAIGAVYATLDRLEEKGLLTSRRMISDGSSRRIFAVGVQGARALAATRAMRDRLWRGIDLQRLNVLARA